VVDGIPVIILAGIDRQERLRLCIHIKIGSAFVLFFFKFFCSSSLLLSSPPSAQTTGIWTNGLLCHCLGDDVSHFHEPVTFLSIWTGTTYQQGHDCHEEERGTLQCVLAEHSRLLDGRQSQYLPQGRTCESYFDIRTT
jgi:hypothetical protein